MRRTVRVWRFSSRGRAASASKVFTMMMPLGSSTASSPYALRIAFIATSHGWSMISALTVMSPTPAAGMIVRPECAAKPASTSRRLAFSQEIVIRRGGCRCGCCCCMRSAE